MTTALKKSFSLAMSDYGCDCESSALVAVLGGVLAVVIVTAVVVQVIVVVFFMRKLQIATGIHS